MQLRLVQDFGVVEGAAVITLNQVAFSPGGGAVTWPVDGVSATHSIYLVPTTLAGGSQPQYAYLDDAGSEAGSFRFGVGYLYPNLFGEKTGDIRLNDTEGVFIGTCGGTATSRLLMPAAGSSMTLEANTVAVNGQGFSVTVGGTTTNWDTLVKWCGAINHDAARSQYLPRVEAPFSITKAKGLVCASGSGSLLVKVNGVTVATEAFTTSSGGSGDDRTLSVSVAADDSVEFQTTGTFTNFRGTVGGVRA